jgi:hypothetical protein
MTSLSYKQIAALHQGAHFAIGDGTRQHPEATVWVYPTNTFGAQDINRPFNAARHCFWRLDFVVFDVDHANAQRNTWFQISKDRQLFIATPRKLQHQVIDAEGVEESQQVLKETLLDRLAAIIAKTEVQRALNARWHATQYMINRFCRPRAILRRTRQIGLVHL